jgi:Mrp family chromosome partitioning ATPase
VNSEFDPGVVVIRTTLEATLTAPFSVAVTSACAGDGKTALAAGLAQTFADAGYRTAIIDANPERPEVARSLGVGTLAVARSLETVTSLRMTSAAPNLEAGSIADLDLLRATSSSALRAFAAELRGLYAVTIWDTGNLFGESLAIQCATACDGVLVAVRYGRRVVPDDVRIVTTLEQVGANVIGIVPTGLGNGTGRGRASLPSSVTHVGTRAPVGQQFWKAGKP